ncbi:host-nuclease inhibitor Gam family protein [Planctellipticum variicoloris]|uniref:host-nuclease inhibitor Gam family protein n=1 Tax=Planctellipticum variicoloris TaxID=3064265 RepID=UPI003014181A|nr:host-nuclease inhibitor Gam family protein [Planctomycetaceae bacterium SH412]
MIPRPETLGVELKLTTLADVDAALHELGWCRQQTAHAEAMVQAIIERLKADNQAALVVKIKESDVSIADRTAALEAALVTWCGKKLAGHLAETGKQSLTLAHGVIGTRSLPDAVVCDDKAVLAAVKKRGGLVGLIDKLLETALGAITLANVIKLKPEVSKTAAKAAWGKSARHQQTLKSLGVVVETNRSSWVIEPAAIEVAAPAG